MAGLVPTAEQTVFPQQGPLPNASPDAFGAQVGAADEHLSSALGYAGDQLADQALRTQGLINAAHVKNADMNFQSQLGDAEAKFYSLSGKAAMDAYPQFKQQLMDLRAQSLGTMTNSVAQGMLDTSIAFTASRAIRSASSYAGEQSKKYVLDTSDARVQNLIQQAAAHPLDDQWFGAAEKTIRGEVAQQGQLMGWSPDQIQAQQNRYSSDIWTTRIGVVANSDIDAATKMFNDNIDKIDASHQASIMYSLQNRQYTQLYREVMIQNRIDAMGEKQLKLQQDQTANNLIADAAEGKPHSTGEIAELLRTGQIDRSGYDAAIKPSGAAKDDLTVVDQFDKQLHAGTLTGATVLDAYSAGTLSATTTKNYLKAIEDPTAGKDAVATASHSALLAAVGGGMETSFFPKEQQQQLMALRAQADQEWTQRVLINREDPTKVLQDMLPRYVQNPSTPVGLPQPMFGPILNQQSLTVAAQKLKAAHDSGAIDTPTFNKNALLIGQYQAFYNFKAKQDAIAKQVKSGKPVTADQGTGQPLVPDTSGGQ